MKKVILGLLFVTSLFGQVNRVLTISPSAEETTLGNQSLAFRNPAKNHFNLDTTTNVSFTNVQWLKNIVDDMGYNYIDVDGRVLALAFYTLITENRNRLIYMEQSMVRLHQQPPNSE